MQYDIHLIKSLTDFDFFLSNIGFHIKVKVHYNKVSI